MAWRDLLLPAAEAADEGVASSGGQHAVLVAIRDVVEHTPEAQRGVLAAAERLVAEGEPIRQPDLAGTIERLAELSATTSTPASWRGRWSTTSTPPAGR